MTPYTSRVATLQGGPRATQPLNAHALAEALCAEGAAQPASYTADVASSASSLREHALEAALDLSRTVSASEQRALDENAYAALRSRTPSPTGTAPRCATCALSLSQLRNTRTHTQ